MGRTSTVKSHPAREEIERGIVEGVPIATLARKWSLSESSLQRHKSVTLRDVLGKVPGDEADIPDVLARLLALANSTRQAREVADRTGTPASRATAQKNELSVLSMLSSRLGVTNLEELDWAKATRDISLGLRDYLLMNPSAFDDLSRALLSRSDDLRDLVDQLGAQLKKDNR